MRILLTYLVIAAVIDTAIFLAFGLIYGFVILGGCGGLWIIGMLIRERFVKD
jgi:hypothetical protein